jgi:hypothetical protein
MPLTPAGARTRQGTRQKPLDNFKEAARAGLSSRRSICRWWSSMATPRFSILARDVLHRKTCNEKGGRGDLSPDDKA